VSRRVRLQSGPLTDWVTRRVGNLDRMLGEADKDAAALFTQAAVLLGAIAQLLTSLGDEAGSLYASSLAQMLGQHSSLKRRHRLRRATR
jgi:hypothetical protein